MVNLINYWACDLEATTKEYNNKQTFPIILGGKNLENDVIIKNRNIKDFIDNFDKKINYIYFNYLEYDGDFFIKWLIKNNFVFKKQKYNLKNNNFYILKSSNLKNIYEIIFIINNKKIIIRDSYKLLKLSIENLGNLINFPKLEIDYNEFNKYLNKKIPIHLMKYFERDIEILHYFLKNLFKKYGTNYMTIGSLTMKLVKKYTPNFNDLFLNQYSKEEWNEFDNAKRGGFTIYNEKWKGILLKNVYSYDVNSMYSSVQYKKYLPYGKPFKKRNNKNDYCLLKIKVIHLIKKDNININLLPNPNFTQENSYVNEVKNHYYWMGETLWNHIVKYHYGKYEIIDRWYFKQKKGIFDNFIIPFKNEKESTNIKYQKLFSKNILNNQYGKMLQDFKRWREVFDNKNKKWEMYYDELQNLTHNVCGIAIPEKARLKMIKYIIPLKDDFYYADTDSLKTSKPLNSDLVDDNEFGKLKLEYIADKFKFLKSKCYIYEIDNKIFVKVSGLSKNIRKNITFNNFKKDNIISNGKTWNKSVIGGKIIYSIDYKL